MFAIITANRKPGIAGGRRPGRAATVKPDLQRLPLEPAGFFV
jgi:hypothetical protein